MDFMNINYYKTTMITTNEILKTICKLIQNFMNLDDNHCYIYNGNWFIPEDKGLCVVVGIDNVKIISNNTYYKETEDNNLQEITEIKSLASVIINIFGYNQEALNRKEEILMSLNNSEAKKIMTEKAFTIFRNPTSFKQINELDGTKILNRFVLEFQVLYNTYKTNNVDYYNNHYNYNLITNN